MEKSEVKPSIVFIFTDGEKFLVEKRLPTSTYANELLFPGGAIEPEEMENIQLALSREILEELGVSIFDPEPIPCLEPIYGHNHNLLHLFLIRKWEGSLPEIVLDKGNEIFWTEIDIMLASPLALARKTAEALRDYLNGTS